MTGRRQAPHNVRVLQRWLTEVEASIGVAVARQQRWVSFMVVAAMLDQVSDENDQPMFLLKGGVALELRLGLHARATRDCDAAFRSEISNLVDKLDEVLRASYGGFSAERSELEEIFELRAAHLWPPRVSVRSHWPAPYRVMADELRFPILDVHEAAQRVSDIIDEIQAA